MTVCLFENAALPGVGIHPCWLPEGVSGVSQHAYQPEGCFTPLYGLRLIKGPWLR